MKKWGLLSGVTAKPPVLRLHRIKTSRLTLNTTEIKQLRRPKIPKRKLPMFFYFDRKY
ncbi:MAG: hypothetical protein U5L45_04895 [Saprospiraceae bacterium]|nr:hypothetical protein [Saprospiraceae bacterium]